MTSSFAVSALTYDLYLVLILALFIVAFFGLIAGVANDAVNFLSSAIGSKSGSKWLILGIAGLGVIIGATFSKGMMEIARSGVFIPGSFVFAEVVIIFLAVMITNIILLDVFNTFGLPTSTTVSIIFELLGAAVGLAVYKIWINNESLGNVYSYINTEKVSEIVIGIFLSIIFAFVGALVIQKITRLIFSFNYGKRFKYLGSLYGGICVATITHFMIIKGAKGSTLISAEVAEYLQTNSTDILLASIVAWTIILQILRWLFKIDILKVIVLLGTFSLAWAFAGNDLVNFIGVPIAGYSAFTEWVKAGLPGPDVFGVGFLEGSVHVPGSMLLGAGIIMACTMFFSKKAHAVVRTSVNLSRQSEGEERFASWAISRWIVAFCVKLAYYTKKLIPAPIQRVIDRQFQTLPEDLDIPQSQKSAFDKLRAASNLLVAGILISIGTSRQIPLSTTFVAFMVAMGSSLADKAWGRESAVYRISGVFLVITGWFFTAFAAFIISFIMAVFMVWGGFSAIFILFGVALMLLIRTHFVFVKKAKLEEKKLNEEEASHETQFSAQKIVERCNKKVESAIELTSIIYKNCFLAFETGDKQLLKQVSAESKELTAMVKEYKEGVLKNIKRLNEDMVETGHYYVRVVDYLREMARAVYHFTKPAFDHFNNSHSHFNEAQCQQLNELEFELEKFFNHCKSVIKKGNFTAELGRLIHARKLIGILMDDMEKYQISSIKNNDISIKNSALFFEIVTETDNVILHLIGAMKALAKFVEKSNFETDNR